MSTKYVIFDCDGGCDDAWALMLLLKAEEEKRIHILAITVCGCGNTDLENAARNMLRILKACNRMDVPIYFGAAESLLPEQQITNTIDKFGREDGFGDVLEADPDFNNVKEYIASEHAVLVINEICSKKPKEVTIIAVGPLTNVALCYNMYGKDFANKVNDIFIMGGNFMGIGNHSRAAEFNFYCDPEAAYIVLNKASCPITILPWETCMNDRFAISLEWRFEIFGRQASATNSAIELLNKVEHSLWMPRGFKMWNPCDAMLVAAYLFGEKFIRKGRHWHATVDLNGLHTRGQMVLDYLKMSPSNAHVIELVDDELFKSIAEWVAGLRSLKSVENLMENI